MAKVRTVTNCRDCPGFVLNDDLDYALCKLSPPDEPGVDGHFFSDEEWRAIRRDKPEKIHPQWCPLLWSGDVTLTLTRSDAESESG